MERPGGPRPVSLTPAGRLLAAHAKAIGARLASAGGRPRRAGQRNGRAAAGRLYQSAGARLLPPVMREFTAAWPRVEVQLSETQDDGELLADLEGGGLDLTFVVFPLTPGPFEAVELLEDPYVLAVPEDSELARLPSPVSPRHLTGVPLITYAEMREAHSIENGLAGRNCGTRSPSGPTRTPPSGPGRRRRRRRHHLVAVGRPDLPGLRLKRLAKVSPRIVGSPGTGTGTASRRPTPSSG